nr:hypothetical protein B0A51_01963 [Rachicladosporium sp. CCFEE 5018]
MEDAANYQALNKANWDERAPEHAKSPDYAYSTLISDPKHLSGVVTFDLPLLDSVKDLHVAHLQCHIATDTLSLARLGAASITGLDLSPESLRLARELCGKATGGEKCKFVEGDVYQAVELIGEGEMDLVFTGIGALCWIPSITKWAEVVVKLLKPGGRLFIREGHPILWALDETVKNSLAVRYPYFETEKPMVFEDNTTYVKMAEDAKPFATSKTVNWNHGLGEMVTALFNVGMPITGLVEHQSVPWEALPGQMVEVGNGEYALREGRERLPLTYTLQAVKL